LDLYSIIKDAISAGVSAGKENQRRQQALLDKLFEIDAELHRCTYYVAQERDRLVRRLRSLPDQDENEVAVAIEKVNQTLSAQGQNIILLSGQAKSFIEILQTKTIYDFGTIDNTMVEYHFHN